MTKYLKIFFAFVLFVILVAQLAATEYFFILINQNNPVSGHRMMQIRAFPEKLRCGITRHWIKNNVPVSGGVLVLGDSQPFGYNAQHTKIFSALLAGSNSLNANPVKNASILDSRFSDTRNVLNIIANINIRLNTVIFDVNPTHFKREYIASRGLPSSKCEELVAWNVFFEKDLLASVKDKIGIHSQDSWLLRDQDADPLPLEIMDGRPLPADYISEQNDKKYEADFISVLEAAKMVSDKIIVYMSPMQLYKKLPSAQNTIRIRYMQLCEQFSHENGGVTCLNTNDQFDKNDYVDIIHFSSSGHKKMADILLPIISHQE